MPVTIEVFGLKATLEDDRTWKCQDKTLLDAIKGVSQHYRESVPTGHLPDPLVGEAQEVADLFVGKVVKVDRPEQGGMEGRVY